MKYIIGNWKSNKTTQEALIWINDFAKLYTPSENTKVIIAPGFMQIPAMFKLIRKHNLKLELAGQDISQFQKGAYTGEVNAIQLAEFAQYCLVGHSERRNNFGETDEILAQKVILAKACNIEPILCVQSANTPIPEEVNIVLYEPIEAIGSGHADSPEHANHALGQIKTKYSHVHVGIYGGSVKPDNAINIINQPAIDGVGVGGASLKPDLFAEIIKNASKI